MDRASPGRARWCSRPTTNSSCAARPAPASITPGRLALGRTVEDAGAQADLALENLTDPARRGGLVARRGLQAHGLHQRSRLPLRRLSDDRQAFPQLCGRSRPGIITNAFARPEVLFELDVAGAAQAGGHAHRAAAALPFERRALWPPRPEARLRVLHGCEGRRPGDPARPDRRRARRGHARRRRRQRRRPSRRCDNVAMLLADAGAAMPDECREGDGLCDRPRLSRTGQRGRAAPPCRHRTRLHGRYREGARQPGAPDGGRHHGRSAEQRR